MEIIVCRRVEDSPTLEWKRTTCYYCSKPILIEEDGLPGTPVCIYCASNKHPNTVVFVELPPDEHGGRAMAKSVREVIGYEDGEWHKSGRWHDQRFLLNYKE